MTGEENERALLVLLELPVPDLVSGLPSPLVSTPPLPAEELVKGKVLLVLVSRYKLLVGILEHSPMGWS